MFQNAGYCVKTKADVLKKMMSTDVGVKKSFMVETVKRQMNVFLTHVFMATVQIILNISFVTVLQGTLGSTVKLK